MRYFLIAGETSGDQHASDLMKALRVSDPDAEFAFVGGPKMRSEGGWVVQPSETLAVMGFLAVARKIRTIAEAGKRVQNALLDFGPDVVICVDFSGFCFKYILPFVNLNLPRAKVVYYIPPKVWAWQKYRVAKLKSLTDCVLCILPFEESFFQKSGVLQAHYVGNPTFEQVENYISTLPIKSEKRYGNGYVALLAGSRLGEVQSNLPFMLEALSRVGRRGVVALAPDIPEILIAELLQSHPELQVDVVKGDTYGVLRDADVALVTSGTATLETALLSVPQVVCYHVWGGKMVDILFQKLFDVRFISLVNLIADKGIVTELFGSNLTPERVAGELRSLLESSDRRDNMRHGYEEVRTRLKGNETFDLTNTHKPASVVAAEAIYSLIMPRFNTLVKYIPSVSM